MLFRFLLWIYEALGLVRLVGTDLWGGTYWESTVWGLKFGLSRKNERGVRPRRWVLFQGRAEASKVPPAWFGWLHYMMEAPAINGASPQPNLTGTSYSGIWLKGNEKIQYDAWIPPGGEISQEWCMKHEK